ncbi:MAG: hypothetical protein AAB701_00040 [Patescibacteria group bacterium]
MVLEKQSDTVFVVSDCAAQPERLRLALDEFRGQIGSSPQHIVPHRLTNEKVIDSYFLLAHNTYDKVFDSRVLEYTLPDQLLDLSHMTPIPNYYIDEVFAELTASEVRVLLYLMRYASALRRRTLKLSYSDIAQGKRTTDHCRLDRGTGLTKRGVILACQELENRGLIQIQRSASMSGCAAVNEITLVRF